MWTVLRSTLNLFLLVAVATLLSSCVKKASIFDTGRPNLPNLAFSRQFGSNSSDALAAGVFARAETYTPGGVIIAGHTGGSLHEPLSGMTDAFVARYDSIGSLLWGLQLGINTIGPGASNSETVTSIAQYLGNAYVAGYTGGSLFEGLGGALDIFVFKVSPAGQILWRKQYGASSMNSTGVDQANGIATDSAGNAIVVGSSTMALASCSGYSSGSDGFMSKLNGTDGTVMWSVCLGVAGTDKFNAVTIDQTTNEIYVLGETVGSLGGETVCGTNDLFVAKYDSNGSQIWIKHYGNTSVGVSCGNMGGGAITLDPSNNRVFISGSTTGTHWDGAGGAGDVVLSALNMSTGAIINTKQFGASYPGTGASDNPNGMFYNPWNNTLLVGGTTSGTLGGSSLGGADYFVLKTDANFTVLSSNQFGTSGTDTLKQFIADDNGFMVFLGTTNASWFNSFAGGADDGVVYKIPSL